MIFNSIYKYSTLCLCLFTLVLSGVLFGLASPALASGSDVQLLKISRRGDTDLSCNALSQEAALMRDIIATTQDIKDGAELKERGIGVVGAIGGVIVGTATAGLGLAAAGLLATHLNDETNDEADSVQDLAAQRRFFMVGIYNAKGCYGPIEHAMNIAAPINIKNANDDVVEHLATIAPAAGPKYYANRRSRYNE